MNENINNVAAVTAEAIEVPVDTSMQSATALSVPTDVGMRPADAVCIPDEAFGFEDANPEDIVIPRIKVINALSPERQDGVASEGTLLNSLTQEDVTGKRFIPIKAYHSNIEWNPDRSAEQRIFCRSNDGRIAINADGACSCAQCGKNKFDNSKTGKEAQPLCTSYLNFLGFIEGSPMPVVLSFARTNYNEGKKLLSIAKSMRQAIWNFSYTLNSRLITKDRNKWYIMVTQMSGETTAAERAMAYELFKSYEDMSSTQVDYEDVTAAAASTVTDDATAAEL